MRRDTDKTRKTSRGRYCNNATDFMSIVYLVGVILLALHLFVLQIVDIHKYREKGRMQRASHDFAVRGDIYDMFHKQYPGRKDGSFNKKLFRRWIHQNIFKILAKKK